MASIPDHNFPCPRPAQAELGRGTLTPTRFSVLFAAWGGAPTAGDAGLRDMVYVQISYRVTKVLIRKRLW